MRLRCVTAAPCVVQLTILVIWKSPKFTLPIHALHLSIASGNLSAMWKSKLLCIMVLHRSWEPQEVERVGNRWTSPSPHLTQHWRWYAESMAQTLSSSAHLATMELRTAKVAQVHMQPDCPPDFESLYWKRWITRCCRSGTPLQPRSLTFNRTTWCCALLLVVSFETYRLQPRRHWQYLASFLFGIAGPRRIRCAALRIVQRTAEKYKVDWSRYEVQVRCTAPRFKSTTLLLRIPIPLSPNCISCMGR